MAERDAGGLVRRAQRSGEMRNYCQQLSMVGLSAFSPSALAAGARMAAPAINKYPATPDLRYFVVKGRLWRSSDPGSGWFVEGV